MPSLNDVIPLDVRQYGRPPKPTTKNPFAQIDWIFKQRTNRIDNPNTRENYQSACRFYKEHVTSRQGCTPYYLIEQWDEFALLRLKLEIEKRRNTGEIQAKSLTVVGWFSAIRQVMKEAASYGILHHRHFHDVNATKAEPETDKEKAYSEAELDQVIKATKSELIFTKTILRGYTATNVGRDPRISPKRGANAGYGYAVEVNMQWYFEHVLKSKAISSTKEHLKQHKSFITSAVNIHGGLNNMYRRWGVSSQIGLTLLMPLVIELIQATGLNPTSCFGLKTDCLRDEHPLTGMPYILYEKLRSGGELHLHLTLLDPRESKFLKREQSHLVKRVISQMLDLTAEIRERLSDDDEAKDTLLIYESEGQNTFGKVMALNSKRTSLWCRNMVAKHELKADTGKPLAFNLVRFRSTKLTEMALAGRDIFEIQQTAGHKNVSQTLAYISKRRLDTHARTVVAEALKTIRSNQKISKKSTTKIIPIQATQTYKGLIGDCKNIFDPPQRVRQSKQYVPGQACTRFNMCLYCHNVIIFREHLPRLVAYRSQILSAQTNNIQNLPNSSFYSDALDVINALMDPDQSPFSPEDIAWSIEAAETADIIIDQVLHRGVEQ